MRCANRLKKCYGGGKATSGEPRGHDAVSGARQRKPGAGA